MEKLGEKSNEMCEWDDNAKTFYCLKYAKGGDEVYEVVLRIHFKPIGRDIGNGIKTVYEIQLLPHGMVVNKAVIHDNWNGTGLERMYELQLNYNKGDLGQFYEDPWFGFADLLQKNIINEGIKNTVLTIINTLKMYYVDIFTEDNYVYAEQGTL